MTKAKEMATMTRAGKALLLLAVKRVGTYDPNRAVPYVEESMTLRDAEIAWEFLAWVHANKLTFGRSTLDATLATFARIQGVAMSDTITVPFPALWALSYFSSVLGPLNAQQDNGAHWQEGDFQISLFLTPPRVEMIGTILDDLTYRLVGYCAYHKIPCSYP